MTTKQNDTAALTDEQLEGVAGELSHNQAFVRFIGLGALP